MEDTLYAEIVESTKRIDFIKQNPQVNYEESSSSVNQDDTNVSSSATRPITSLISTYVYTISIDEAEKRQDSMAILKSTYICYGIKVKRSSDEEEHVVWKRYKEIDAFYQEILTEFETLRNNRAVVFPTTQDSWLSGNASDPSCEFVKTRRVELQTFFRQLFAIFPFLFEFPPTVDFLQLSAFSPEAKKSMSLYIQPEAQAQATVGSQEQLTDDTVQPISYFDTIKLKEPSAYFRSSKTSISVAELLPDRSTVPLSGKASPCFEYYRNMEQAPLSAVVQPERNLLIM